MVDAAKAVADGDLEPPGHVDVPEAAMPFWLDITRARARSEWSRIDMTAAANLARCCADIERLSAELMSEEDIVQNARGTPVVNPKHALLETLTRRHAMLTRMLQIQPAASGKTENKRGAREAERKAREVAEQIAGETAEAAELLA